MSDDKVNVTEFTRISKATVAEREIQQVWLWDIGPEEPTKPVAPEPAKTRTPIALVEEKFAAEAYEAAMRQYDAEMREYVAWTRRYGGPFMIQMWGGGNGSNAQNALQNDARAVEEKRQTRRRWYISSRTRGFHALKNHGLPEGMSPGRWHGQMIEREVAGEADYIAARKADPVFGMEMAS